MLQRVSSTYRQVVGLAIILSMVGALCLSLAGVLPWPVFIAVLSVHILALRLPYDRDIISAKIVTIALLGFTLLEILRVWMGGRGDVAFAIRDMIVALDIARLLLKKELREIYQVLGISFSELVFATIFTLSLTFTISLVFMIFLIPMALYLVDGIRFGSSEHVPGPRHWLKIGSSIIFLTCILFYIIPRPYDTILRSNTLHRHKTGFTENIDLGQDSRISVDDSIVMRIVWHGKYRPRTFLLAGAHLEKATSSGFERSSRKTGVFSPTSRSMYRLTIYPKEIDAKNVFHPFSLVNVSPGEIRREGDDYYWIYSTPAVYDVWVSKTPETSDACSVQVPRGFDDLTALARRIAPKGDAGRRVAAIIAYLRHHCKYTLAEQHRPKGMSPIKWFVMDGGSGDCEYFASSLALMLRGLDIPSRVVAGFYVHEYNPLGDYYIVRASAAHAWVEYWDRGVWHTADPTPPELGLYTTKPSLLDEIRFKWIRWVIHYSLNDQIYLAGYFGNNLVKPGGKTIYWIPGLILAAFISWLGLAGKLWHRRATFYKQVLEAFNKKGIKLDTRASHEEHLRSVEQIWPDMAPYFENYLGDYLLWRFGHRDIDIASITHRFIEKLRARAS